MIGPEERERVPPEPPEVKQPRVDFGVLGGDRTAPSQEAGWDGVGSPELSWAEGPSCGLPTSPFPLSREELESGLTFLGLLVMENRLKSETQPVLQELSQARIRSVMVTGVLRGRALC